MAQLIIDVPDAAMPTLASAMAPDLVGPPQFDEDGFPTPPTEPLALLAWRIVNGDTHSAADDLVIVNAWTKDTIKSLGLTFIGSVASTLATTEPTDPIVSW